MSAGNDGQQIRLVATCTLLVKYSNEFLHQQSYMSWGTGSFKSLLVQTMYQCEQLLFYITMCYWRDSCSFPGGKAAGAWSWPLIYP